MHSIRHRQNLRKMAQLTARQLWQETGQISPIPVLPSDFPSLCNLAYLSFSFSIPFSLRRCPKIAPAMSGNLHNVYLGGGLGDAKPSHLLLRGFESIIPSSYSTGGVRVQVWLDNQSETLDRSESNQLQL